MVAGGGGQLPCDNFLGLSKSKGALKFVVANVKYYTSMSRSACHQVQRL